MNATVVVRFTSGLVSESRRHSHLATAPEDGIRGSWLTFCGLEIPAHQAEVYDRPTGMPCARCLSGVADASALDGHE